MCELNNYYAVHPQAQCAVSIEHPGLRWLTNPMAPPPVPPQHALLMLGP